MDNLNRPFGRLLPWFRQSALVSDPAQIQMMAHMMQNGRS